MTKFYASKKHEIKIFSLKSISLKYLKLPLVCKKNVITLDGPSPPELELAFDYAK
jgi:hypothetical protein